MSEQLRFAMQLPAHARSVAVARSLVRHLHGLITDDQVDRAEIIMSELVTNAIRHGSDSSGYVQVEVTADGGALRASVTDHGPAFSVPLGPPRLDQTGGFGLYIVGQLTSVYRIERSATGNVVTFSV